jgi:gamma-glutamyltranspeptidase/glutathione hydrolase
MRGVRMRDQYDQYRMKLDGVLRRPLSVARGGCAVASVSGEASKLAVDVLKDGGNAFDAAFMLALALSVCHPQAGNLGGGGYLIFKEAHSKAPLVYDYRERSSSHAKREYYLTKDGTANPELTAFGPSSVCVPGTVSAFYTLQRRYGVLNPKDLLVRLAALARRGCSITDYQAQCLNRLRPKLMYSPGSRKIYVKERGSFQQGEFLPNADLAKTFESLAREGEDSFYRGEIAERIERDLSAHGGYVTVGDLQSYTVREARPIASELNGFTIWTVPPEGGGAILIEIINILKREEFFNMHPSTVEFYHYLAQAAKLSFIDRMAYMGDCEYERIETYTSIFDQDNTQNHYSLIEADRDIPTEEYLTKLHHEGLLDAAEPRTGGLQTTHFSILDDRGNAVSNSYTLNLRYGSKWTVEGTGVLMNGSTDSFSFVPGKPNYFGMVGNRVNLFEPNKRPASNMAPVLVTKGRDVHLLIGTPGGPTIPTSLAAILFALLVHGISPEECIREGRIHHQAWPDVLFRENDGRLIQKEKDLAAKGYTIRQRNEPIGDMHGIFRDEHGYFAVSDYRRGGVALSI